MRSRIWNLPEAAPRLIKIDGSRLGIITFDEDNGYPQRMATLINACSTAKQSVKLLTDYTIGQGFNPENPFYKTPINDKRLTPDKLLRRIAADKSAHRGFAIQINYNALYQPCSVNYVPFETTRLGANQNEGKICLHSSWYNTSTLGRYVKYEDVVPVDMYNPDPFEIAKQVSDAGGWDQYKGQIYWYSDEFETYPLSPIDPVIESVIAEIESDKTTTNNLRNNFQAKFIWVEKGKFEDNDEKREHEDNIKQFVGPNGKPLVVVESVDPEGKDKPELIEIKQNLNDKLFQYTDEKVRAKIYRAFGQPAILHSDYMGSNGYNEGQLPQSMQYYTNFTHPDRIVFEEVFTEIFSKWETEINPQNDYKIVPLANVNDNSQQNGNTTTNI